MENISGVLFMSQVSISFNTSKLRNEDDAEDKQNIYTEFARIEHKNDKDVNLATISVKQFYCYIIEYNSQSKVQLVVYMSVNTFI